MTRMRLNLCEEDGEAAEIATAMALDRHASSRAFLLARRLADLMDGAGARPGLEAIGQVARASETLEHLLISDPGDDVRLGMFLDRFLGLRVVVAGSGIFRLSASDVNVHFELARSVAYIVCDLIGLIERIEAKDGLDVRIAVEPDGDTLLVAISADGVGDTPVSTLAGSRALQRAEGFIHSIGGSIARGVKDGEMLFGVGLPVFHV